MANLQFLKNKTTVTHKVTSKDSDEHNWNSPALQKWYWSSAENHWPPQRLTWQHAAHYTSSSLSPIFSTSSRSEPYSLATSHKRHMISLPSKPTSHDTSVYYSTSECFWLINVIKKCHHNVLIRKVKISYNIISWMKMNVSVSLRLLSYLALNVAVKNWIISNAHLENMMLSKEIYCILILMPIAGYPEVFPKLDPSYSWSALHNGIFCEPSVCLSARNHSELSPSTSCPATRGTNW